MNDVEQFDRSLPRADPLLAHDGRTRFPSGRAEGAVPLLTQYLGVLVRWKWLILGAIAAMVLAAFILTMLMTPLYTATSSIEIARDSDRVLKTEGVEREVSTSDMEFYQTQYGLLKSRQLAERVVRDMRLAQNRRFLEVHGLEGAAVPQNAAARTSQIARALLANVVITPVRASRLVEISYTSPDPVLSAQIADQWGRSFIQSNLERRFDATAYARKFLETRLAQIRQRMEESERALVSYAASQGIVNLPAAVVPGQPGAGVAERSVIADNLAALNGQLLVATSDRVKAESRLRQSGGTSPEALNNAGISSLRARRAELNVEYARLMSQFEPDYPPARTLASQIAQLDANIGREEARVGSSIRASYDEALRRENGLRSKVDQAQAELLDLRRRSIQYNIYQREVDTNRQLYDGLLQRYKEVGVVAGVGSNNVSVVDRAEVPTAPSKPNLLVNLLLALLVGLGLGGLIALALEQIDEAINDPTDVEQNLNLPLLGVIPYAGDEGIIQALADPKSPATEAYISVRTNLGFATTHGIPRSISVTSTRPAEGKSSTVYALALLLARSKRSVIVVDADMRSPSLNHLHGIDNGQGLSNFLSGNDDMEGLVRPSGVSGLTLMTAGPQPPNAAELLSGSRLDVLLERLLERYDHVVIDSPPVMGLADAPLIASKVEAVIYGVEARGTRVRLIQVALNRLVSANAHLLGVVLTKFKSKSARFGYGYGYDYGYGYGQGSKSSE